MIEASHGQPLLLPSDPTAEVIDQVFRAAEIVRTRQGRLNLGAFGMEVANAGYEMLSQGGTMMVVFPWTLDLGSEQVEMGWLRGSSPNGPSRRRRRLRTPTRS